MEHFIFILITIMVLLGALGAVSLKYVFHNALCLGVSLIGIAGLYVYLEADFLAAIQIIIYVGAILIAIIFSIMLSRPIWLPQKPVKATRIVASTVLSALFFVAIAKILLQTNWPTRTTLPERTSIADIGKALLGQYLLPFEAISLILLIVILGAISMTQSEEASS